MAKMTKSKIQVNRARKKRRQNSLKEKQDDLGIRKKKKTDGFMLDPKIFYIAKGVLIIFIILSSLYYSLLLLPLVALYGSFYYFSFATEKYINKGYHKESEVKVFKLDAAFAIITIIVSLSSSIFTLSRSIGAPSRFLERSIMNMFSLSMGVKNSFTGNKGYGTMNRPSGGVGGMGMGGKPTGRPNFDIGDIPLEFAFSQILTSIIQFIFYTTLVLGVISICVYLFKKYGNKKILNLQQNEKNKWELSEDDLKRLLNEKV